MTRRALLAATGGVAIASATGCDWWDSSPPPPPLPPDPLEPLLAGARAVRDRYQQTLAAHPDLAERLGSLLDSHRQHVTALLEIIGRPAPATPTAPPSDTPPPGGPGVPDDPEDALSGLRRAEQDAYDEAWSAGLAAPPDRVALLGSICAARAAHLEVLG